MVKRNTLPEPGTRWVPRRPGSRAKPRTVVWAGRMPDAMPPAARIWPGVTVGWVEDPARPGFPATGHDSWFGIEAWRAWVRKHQATPEVPA